LWSTFLLLTFSIDLTNHQSAEDPIPHAKKESVRYNRRCPSTADFPQKFPITPRELSQIHMDLFEKVDGVIALTEDDGVPEEEIRVK
jgi:hypothetical protein